MPPANQPLPPGQPLDWTAEQLDALSAVGPADVEQAKSFWRQHAPQPLQELLDAETDERPLP